MRDWITTETQTAAIAFSVNPTEKIKHLQSAIEQVIKGKPEVVKFTLVTLIAKGHLLIEDVPGIGKTTLSNALARALDIDFQRIQFTSDLLPSDVVGLSIFNQLTGNFEWKAGAIFANIILADEINRATPKTQSALLEAMAEGQVTADGISRKLPLPFMVVATQNPTEHHGTYPLPESQLDRFMLRINVGYPAKDHERQMLRDRERNNPLDSMTSVMSEADVLDLQQLASEVRVDESLVSYLLEIVEQTRSSEQIELGISPRGTISLFRAAQSLALIEGRDFCIVDDIKRLVLPCFAHRIIVNSRFTNTNKRNAEADRILQEILLKTKVPL
jgi:MoxR-like ATPase